MPRQRRLRKLVPDDELIRRKAAGEPLRSLAADYGVAHTTLSDYFRRPDVAAEVKQAETQQRDERRAAASRRAAERRLEQDVRRRARQQAAAEREQVRGVDATVGEIAASLRRPRNDFEAWLDERDAREPLTRADLHSENDEIAARVVGAGGGIRDVIEATDLHTLENVTRLIDPAILQCAYDNDHLRQPKGFKRA